MTRLRNRKIIIQMGTPLKRGSKQSSGIFPSCYVYNGKYNTGSSTWEYMLDKNYESSMILLISSMNLFPKNKVEVEVH